MITATPAPASIADLGVLWQLLQPLLWGLPRVGALFVIAPLIVGRAMPSLVRNAVVLSFCLCLYPFMSRVPATAPGLLEWVGLASKEVLVGALMGYAVGVFIWVFEGVGSLIDIQSGLSNAMLFEPFGGHESGVFGVFMNLFAGALFIGCGGLYVLLALLFDSYRLWPPGSFQPQLGGLLAAHGLDGMARVTELTVRLAAPAVLVLVIVEVGIGMIGRVAPQLNVFFFSVPIKCVVAALMLAVSLAYLVDFARGHLVWLEGLLSGLAQALGLPAQ